MATASLSIPADAAPRAAINPWVVALTVTLATFMELLDTSIANVSLPYIAGGLGRPGPMPGLPGPGLPGRPGRSPGPGRLLPGPGFPGTGAGSVTGRSGLPPPGRRSSRSERSGWASDMLGRSNATAAKTMKRFIGVSSV